MAKYNLLEDDDLFEDEEDDLQLPEDTENDSAKPDELTDNDNLDIDIDEDLLNIENSENLSDSAFDVNADINIGEEEPEINIDEPNLLNEESEAPPDTDIDAQEPELLNKEAIITDDYEDEKQAGINYKPIVIAGVIIIILILAYIGIDHFFLSGPTVPTLNQQTTTGQDGKLQGSQKEAMMDAKAKQEQKKKQKFLQNISMENQAKAELTGKVLGAVTGKASLSSLLLYDRSFLFEIFGKSRDDLAKVNVRLKNSAPAARFNVVSSNVRPGSQGGVLSVFKGRVSSSVPSAGLSEDENAKSIDALEGLLRDKAQKAGLKTKGLVNRFEDEQSGFKRFNVQATFEGSLKNTQNFIASISNSSQINIHKMQISAKDQKTFSKKKYSVSLILKVFI